MEKIMKKLISANIVNECYKDGLKYIYVDDKNTIITSEAKDLAQKYNIKFNYCNPISVQNSEIDNDSPQNMVPVIVGKIISQLGNTKYDKEHITEIVNKYLDKDNKVISSESEFYKCEKGPNRLKVIRGSTIKLNKFNNAGENKNVKLTDIITQQDGSPMSVGIMSWKKADSFPWELTYDEIDYVIEGELQITIDGQMFSGKAGDVFYIPKGSKIIFGTPNHTKIMYVTYPANWSA